MWKGALKILQSLLMVWKPWHLPEEVDRLENGAESWFPYSPPRSCSHGHSAVHPPSQRDRGRTIREGKHTRNISIDPIAPTDYTHSYQDNHPLTITTQILLRLGLEWRLGRGRVKVRVRNSVRVRWYYYLLIRWNSKLHSLDEKLPVHKERVST